MAAKPMAMSIICVSGLKIAYKLFITSFLMILLKKQAKYSYNKLKETVI